MKYLFIGICSFLLFAAVCVELAWLLPVKITLGIIIVLLFLNLTVLGGLFKGKDNEKE